MKALIIKYKPVIRFISLFVLVYVLLSFLYKIYLQWQPVGPYFPDYLSYVVGKQSVSLLQDLGYNAAVIPHPNEASLKLMLNNVYIARIFEGCNGVSVISLFVAFIVAFSGKATVTFFYILSGSVLIYSVNLLRIVILTLGLYHYPQHKALLHEVVFPGIIYGLVCLLWILWVNRFSKIASKE
ncbi:exosortase family protein XrtF [Bizionia sediminis]|uniref:Exosortase family protein XrtF n=1 Tax=Bizionia sediminis TaxID=1737064 RepID=A0ABW5KTR1_9FLAO